MAMELKDQRFPNLNNVSSMSEADIEQFRDARGYKIPLIAAETGHLEAVNGLINRGFEFEDEIDGKTPADLAFDNKHFNIVLNLLESNFKFPRNYDNEAASEDLKEFVRLSSELHDCIKSEEIEKLKEILTQNPHLKYFYNAENKSAVRVALEQKNVEIYELLLTNRVYISPSEDFNNIIKVLSYSERRQLRELHSKLSTNVLAEPITTFMQNSHFGPDCPDQAQYRLFVYQAYIYLMQIPCLAIMLNAVAASRFFKIVFDFKRETVSYADPTSEPYTNGLFYPSGKIYIGAKGMLDPTRFYEVLGVMAHELCHYAMFLVYGNNAKPYYQKDKVAGQIFDEITNECEANKEAEELVGLVFNCYPKSMQHAETIVRAPHMLAQYHENQETLQEKKETFPSLFDNFEKSCVPEMERAIPKIKKKFKTESEKKLEKQQKMIFWISIAFGLFVVFAIGLGLWINSLNCSWGKLSDEQKLKVNDSTVNYFGVEVKFGELFPNNSEVYNSLNAKQICGALDGDPAELSKSLNVYDSHINLSWLTLPLNLKHKLLNSNVTFQGESIKINKFLTNESTALSYLEGSQIKTIIKKSKISIFDKIKSKSNFFVERVFVKENFDFNNENEDYDDEEETIGEPVIVDERGNEDQSVEQESETKEGRSDEEDNEDSSEVQDNEDGSGNEDQSGDQENVTEKGSNNEGSGEEEEDIDDSIGEPDYDSNEGSSDNFDDFKKNETNTEKIDQDNFNKENSTESEDESYDEDQDDSYEDYDNLDENRIKIDKNLKYYKKFEDLINLLKEKKIFLLSSIAGEGKSTTFQNLGIKIKRRYSWKLVIIVDLKKYVNAFNDGRNLNFNDKDQFVKFLKETFYQIELEKELFVELFEKGDVIFFWDGADEIFPQYQDFMINLIKNVSSTANWQLISTRPQYSEVFQKKLNITAYKLVPLDERSQFEFLVKFIVPKEIDSDLFCEKLCKLLNKNTSLSYDSIKDSDILSYLEQFNKTQITEIFLTIEKDKQILNTLKKSENRLVANPLLIQMIVEIGYKISNIKTIDSYTLYNTFVDKKVNITSGKGVVVKETYEKIRSDYTTDFKKIHEPFAFKLIFKGYLEEHFKEGLAQIDDEIKNTQELIENEEFSKFGILTVKSDDDYDFIHRTFAEYFVAQYFIYNAHKIPDNEKKIKLFLLNSILYSFGFPNVLKFITDFVESSRKTPPPFIKYLQNFNLKQEQLKNSVDSFKELQYLKFSYTSSYFLSPRVSFNEIFYREVWFFVGTFKNLQKLIKNWREIGEVLGADVLKTLLKIQNEHGESFLLQFLKGTTYPEGLITLKETLIIYNDTFGQSFIKEYYFNQNKTKNMLMVASQNQNFGILNFIWNMTLENFDHQAQKEILLMKDSDYFTSLQHSAYSRDKQCFLFIIQIYKTFFKEEEIREILLEGNRGSNPFTSYIAYSISYDNFQVFLDYIPILFKDHQLDLRKLLSGFSSPEHLSFGGYDIYRNPFRPNLDKVKDLLRKTYSNEEQEIFELDFAKLYTCLEFRGFEDMKVCPK